jgi:hypothetical protein
MPAIANEHYLSPAGTLTTLSYRQDKNIHVITFDSEDGQGPIVKRFPGKESARDHWRYTRETLAALGFKRI